MSCFTHMIGSVSLRAKRRVVKTIEVAAGAVVIRDLEPNCLYAGVPAKKLENFEFMEVV